METTHVATDNAHPYVAWTLPQDIYQSRYAVKITCVETGAIAYATSGERIGSEGFFQFPTGIALNNNFDGLCICEVAVSVSSQIGADFEYISAPFYFVFDHDLEKLFNARKLTLTWNAATDPDHLPLGLGRYFHVQVARDPQFSDLAYENTGIPNLADAVIVFDVPDNQLVLEDDHAYFYRVRMSDGMDYGAWSLANAFHNYSNVPPVVRVVSIEPLFTKDGDYKITFTLDDSNGGDASVEFYYTGAGEIALTPVSLISAPVHIDSGTHEVICAHHAPDEQPALQRRCAICPRNRPGQLRTAGFFPDDHRQWLDREQRRRHRFGQIHRGRASRLGHAKAQ